MRYEVTKSVDVVFVVEAATKREAERKAERAWVQVESVRSRRTFRPDEESEPYGYAVGTQDLMNVEKVEDDE